MELQEFIESVLLQVTEAVRSAKRLSPVAIAPDMITYLDTGASDRVNDRHTIDFDIGLAVRESSSKKAEGGVNAGITVVGAKVNGEKTDSLEKDYDHRIKFSIPVYFNVDNSSYKKS